MVQGNICDCSTGILCKHRLENIKNYINQNFRLKQKKQNPLISEIRRYVRGFGKTKEIALELSDEELINQFREKINFTDLCECYTLSENFIREFINEINQNLEINWNGIVSNKSASELSIEFIREFQDYLDWVEISHFRKLSEDFIREFQDKVNWYEISIYNFNESFIEEFKDKIVWETFSKNIDLTEKIIEKYQDRVDWKQLSIHNRNLSKEFIKKFHHKFHWKHFVNSINVNKDLMIWAYQTNESAYESIKNKCNSMKQFSKKVEEGMSVLLWEIKND